MSDSLAVRIVIAPPPPRRPAPGRKERDVMDIESAQRRYRDDPVFRELVMAMMGGMERLQFSPGELREAAVFAEIYFYQRHPYPSPLVAPPWPWPPSEAAARAASAPATGAQGGPEGAGKP